MTNTYNTLNPLGSTSPKDLFDNASNFDEGMNSALPSFYDRFQKRRQTWAGMQKLVVDFLEAMGFEATHLQYVDGTPLTVLRPTQLIDRAGSVYKIKAPANFPVNLTGTWATDQLLVVDVGDASLRAALAATTGAEMIGTAEYDNLQLNLDALKVGQFVTPEQFGAVGDGVTDDGAELQSAIDFAQDNGGYLFLRHKYLSNQTLLQTKRLTVQGTGKMNAQIIYGGTGDAWLATLPIASGNSNNDWNWFNFGIVPEVAGSGQYGLHVKLQAAGVGTVSFMADSRVSGMYFGDFGNQGLYLDNSVSNVDGFFTSQFEYNTVTNGILGEKLGDSLTFAHNKVFGRNCGIEITGVAGARQLIINDNNITTHGGLIALLGVEEPTLLDNQLEHPGYLSGYTGTFGAGVLLFNCYKPLLWGNTINPDNGAASAPVSPGIAPSAIALTGNTFKALIDQNDIQKGGADHISISTSTVVSTQIGEHNTYYGAFPPVVSNAGTNTIFQTVRNDAPYSATVGAGVVTGQSISVPGARLGGFVQADYSTGSQGLEMRGWVAGTDVVQVRIENNTGAPITISGGSIVVKVSY